MKKKILTLVSAFALTLALPMTALAGPSPRTTYEASAVVGKALAYDQREVTSADQSFKYHYVTTDLIDAIRTEEYNTYIQSLAEKVTILDVSKADFKETKAYTLNVSGVTATDSIVVLLYNAATNTWDQVRAYTTDAGTVTFNADPKYSYFQIINDGTLSDAQITEKATTSIVNYLNGGKTSATPFALNTDLFNAPQTGDASMTFVVIAGVACLAVAVASKKRLAALN